MRLLILTVSILAIGPRATFAALDPALLRLAPPGSKVLVGIDVKRAGNSRAGSYMLEQTLSDPGIAKLTSIMGLNARRDLRQILLIGPEPQSASGEAYVVIANGSFNPARLMAVGQSRGASIRRFQRTSILVETTARGLVGVAFPQPGILLMGELGSVQTALRLDSLHGGLDPALRELIDRIGPASDFWFATILPGSFLIQQMGDALPAQLRNSGALDRISESSGGLQFGRSDKMTLNLITQSTGDARLLSGLLHLAGSLAHLQLGGSAGLTLAKDAFGSMQVTVEGTTVNATSSMPDAQLERALASN